MSSLKHIKPAVAAVSCFLMFGTWGLATAHADPIEDLARSKNCFACHAVQTHIVGPAYKDVAAKYKGKKDAVTYLAGRIKTGSVGDWGQIPMPANPVTDAEAKQLAQWVLARK